MRHFAMVLVLATAGTAAAQPAPPAPPPEGAPPPEAPPPPTPPPPAPPPPRPAPPPRVEHEESTEPEQLSIGLGFGWVFPDNVETPNTVSAVLRLPSGLTFEPRVILQSTSKTTDPGIPGVPSTTDKTSDLEVALLLRYPIAHHGRFELELVGSAAISQHKVNPDGPDNDTTTNTQALDWGVGINYWLSRHWALSAIALNPLLSRSSTESPNGLGMGMTQTNTTTTYGIVFDPSISFLIHLYH